MGESTKVCIKNNSLRNHGFAGRLCLAGTGCPTPEDAAKMGLKLPEKFELDEAEFFRSHRGILATMAMRLPNGGDEIEVLVNGEKLSKEDILGFVREYRKRHNLPEPTTPDEHHAELVAVSPKFRDMAQEAHDRVERERAQANTQMIVDVVTRSMEKMVDELVAKKVAAALAKKG